MTRLPRPACNAALRVTNSPQDGPKPANAEGRQWVEPLRRGCSPLHAVAPHCRKGNQGKPQMIPIRTGPKDALITALALVITLAVTVSVLLGGASTGTPDRKGKSRKPS